MFWIKSDLGLDHSKAKKQNVQRRNESAQNKRQKKILLLRILGLAGGMDRIYGRIGVGQHSAAT